MCSFLHFKAVEESRHVLLFLVYLVWHKPGSFFVGPSKTHSEVSDFKSEHTARSFSRFSPLLEDVMKTEFLFKKDEIYF